MLLHPYPLPGTPLGYERTIVAVVDDDHVKSNNKLIAIVDSFILQLQLLM